MSLLFLISCGPKHRSAPVRNLSIEPVNQKLWKVGRYKVRKNDTLYSIAFKFDLDFQQLVRINQISKPYKIYPGDELQLRYAKKQASSSSTPKKHVAEQQRKKTVSTSTSSTNTVLNSNSTFDTKKKVAAWFWPVNNKGSKKIYLNKDDQQGINISGSLGDPIKASADGRVVYSGNGLVGYGNLIIIKHSRSYLSAYAHNDSLLVKEKQVIKAGQKIATMGTNGTGRIQLHFEIRFQGRQVDPLKYLPSLD
ncbi:MAG: peptidoglycan DD-metalloendopeptidase family protein [Gammaproteobacteria bacterium]|nr:peptidoglycan DD-metalloendopeptidase family protein [Gammaproteobacteria bacterium]